MTAWQSANPLDFFEFKARAARAEQAHVETEQHDRHR
jgi:hypothetical protein